MSWQLITIPFSHFCEKARWALDLALRPYQERAYLPGFHAAATRRYGRSSSVPLLLADAMVVPDSAAILRFADRHRPAGSPSLFGADPATESLIAGLAQWLDETIGPATRLLAYYHLLPSIARLVRVVGGSCSPRQRLGLRVSFPLLKPVLAKSYGIHASGAAAAIATIQEVFRATDAALAANNNYLVNGMFTAADLTLAALSAPILLWPEARYRYDDASPAFDALAELPPDFAAQVVRFRATSTGAHCRRVYMEHRRPRPRAFVE